VKHLRVITVIFVLSLIIPMAAWTVGKHWLSEDKLSSKQF